jgi:hypothetical protein
LLNCYPLNPAKPINSIETQDCCRGEKSIQHDRARAEFCDGILTLTLPKSEEYRHRVVKINLGEMASATPTATLEAASEQMESESSAAVATAA